MKKIILTLFVAAFFCLCFASVPTPDASLNKNSSIKLGVAVCLTGKCAEWGSNALMGAKLAVAEINKLGGVSGKEVEILVEDTQEENTSGAISAYNVLKRKGVNYFIGPSWTTAAQALAPIVSKDQSVIMISPSVGVREFNESGINLFSLWPHDEISTKKLAKLAISKGWKRAGVFSSQQPWEQLQGKVFHDEFVALGGEVSAHVEPLSASRDLKVEALKIVKTKPDVVFISNFTSMGVAARELENLHYKGQKIVILVDETRLKDAQGALNEAYVAMYSEASKDFQESFKRMYGVAPSSGADTAYDSVKLLYFGLIKLAGKQSALLSEEMLRTRFKGATGNLQLDDQGGVIREPVLYKIKNETFNQVAWQ